MNAATFSKALAILSDSSHQGYRMHGQALSDTHLLEVANLVSGVELSALYLKASRLSTDLELVNMRIPPSGEPIGFPSRLVLPPTDSNLHSTIQHAERSFLQAKLRFCEIFPLATRKGRIFGLIALASHKRCQPFTHLQRKDIGALTSAYATSWEARQRNIYFQGIIDHLHDAAGKTRVLRTFLSTAISLMDADRGDIALWSDQRNNLIYVATDGPTENPEVRVGNVIPRDGFLSRLWVEHEKEIAVTGNVLNERSYYCALSAVRSELGVVFRVNQKLVGILNLESCKEDWFDSLDKELARELSKYTAIAVQIVGFKGHLDPIIRSTPHDTANIQSVLNGLLQSAEELYGFEEGVIYIADYSQRLLRAAANRCDVGATERVRRFSGHAIDGQSLAAWVFENNVPRFVSDPIADPTVSREGLEIFDIQGPMLGLPLRNGAVPIGAMVLWSRRNAPPAEVDTLLLEPFADVCASKIVAFEAPRILEQEAVRYRQLFETAPFGYHELDKEGRITEINSTELQMLGYVPDQKQEVVGRPIWEFVRESERVLSETRVRGKLTGTESGGTVFRTFRRKDGTFVPLRIDDAVVTDELGRITGIRSMVQSTGVSDKLQDETFEFTSTVEETRVPVCIFEKDRESRFTYANKAFLRDIGKEKEGLAWLRGKSDFDVYSGTLAAKYVRDDQDVIGTSRPLEVIEENDSPVYGLRLVHVLKKPMWNRLGAITGIRGIYWEAKRMPTVAEWFEQSSRLLHQLFASSRDAILIHSGLRIHAMNPAAEKLLGITLQEMTRRGRRSVLRWIAPTDRKRVKARIRQSKAGQLPDIAEERFLSLAGDGRFVEVPTEVAVSPLHSGGVIYWLVIARDLSERKRLETLRVREIHHHVRNNLNRILAFLDIKAKDLEDTRGSLHTLLREVRGIVRQMERLHTLVYRPGTPATSLRDHFIAVAQLAFGLYKDQSGTVSLNLDISEDAFQLSYEQANACSIIITELIRNATKHAFAPGAGGRISVRLKKEGHVLRLQASNTRSLEEPIRPAESSGTGLGLVKDLVQLELNGKLTINDSTDLFEVEVRFAEDLSGLRD